MDDLEAIKKKKLQEMMANQNVDEQQAQQQIQQLDNLVKQYLTKEALARFGNIKMAHPEKAMNILGILAQMIQQGHIKNKIDDNQLKEILKQLEPKKPSFNITRK